MPEGLVRPSEEQKQEPAGTAPQGVTDAKVGEICANCCVCTGYEKAYFVDENSLKSYSGEFVSPFKLMNYIDNKIVAYHPPSEIRGWIRDAARYHGIPHSFLAVILQQENGPGSSGVRKFLQFGERQLTTLSDKIDRSFGDIVPDRISGSSSGFANMSRRTLQKAAIYTIENYCKNPIEDKARYRKNDSIDVDTRISGYDWRADLYYCASHIRELIDKIKGKKCYAGPLDYDDAGKVFAGYNGSGDAARKYGNDSVQKLKDNIENGTIIHFYQK